MASKTVLSRLQHISRRYARKSAKKDQSNSLLQQSQAIASMVVSQTSQTLDDFINSNGAISNINDAYEIQNNVSSILESEHNYSRLGYKLGLTSSNIQNKWNVTNPFISPFYSKYNFNNTKTAEKQQQLTIGVESEFIFKINNTLNIDDYTSSEIGLDEIYSLIECIYPGQELIELRIAPNDNENNNVFSIPIEYLISDLCWTGGVVIGKSINLKNLGYRSWKEYDENELRDAAVEIYVDGNQKGIGYGREVLGSPFNAIQYLYNYLLKEGKTVNAGEFISTGTCTGCTMIDKNEIVESVFENIGDVEFKLV